MNGRIAMRIAGMALAAAAAGVVALLGFAFVPTIFGAEALIVTSGSMGNAAPVGSVAVTRLVDANAISVGDIISFRYPESPMTTTHRVVSVETQDGRRIFRTKGDANTTMDPLPVPITGRVHRVERVVPFAGRVAVFARTPFGIATLFLIPLGGLLLDERRRRRSISPPAEEPTIALPVRADPHPDAFLLGAIAGIVVAGAVAFVGGRPRRAAR